MLKGKFYRSYKKAGANGPMTIFVYKVTGSDDAILDYETTQGTNFRETEDKEPLYFSTRFGGDNISIIKTQNDRFVVDMSEYDKANSLATQFGGNFGQEIARVMAEKLGSFKSTPQSVTPATPAPAGEKVD